MSVGVRFVQTYVPEKRLTSTVMAEHSTLSVEAIEEKTGVYEKPILEDQCLLLDMALEATRLLLTNNSVDPQSIDLIIYASCGIYDKQFWSPGAALQNCIKADNAFSFEVNNGCNAGNTAIFLAKSLLEQWGKRRALVVSSDALSRLVDYTNEDHIRLFSFSDGASALLLEKGTLQNTLLSFKSITDGYFANHISIPPYMQRVTVSTDAEKKKQLSNNYFHYYYKLIKETTDALAITPQDIDHLFMNQADFKLISVLRSQLGLNNNVIFQSYPQYGHLGNSDVFFGFSDRLKNNQIQTGDIILFATSGIGFSWSVSALRA